MSEFDDAVKARIAKHKAASRKKVLKLLDRKQLESLSNRESPWHSDWETLVTEIINDWPADEVREQVIRILDSLEDRS